MSQRDGPATAGADPPPRPADALPPTAMCDRDRHLLDLARRQGFLFASQIPAPEPKADPAVQMLRQALSDRLAPAPLADPVVSHDRQLDEAQLDAVARAIHIPDLLVIEGPAGTGKTRVAIEIVRQVVDRAGRVLLLSPDSTALDASLPGLTAHSGLVVERRLGPGESTDRLPAAVAVLTPAGRVAKVRESLVRGAADALAASEEQCRRAASADAACEELSALDNRRATRSAERHALVGRQVALEGEVRREAESGGDDSLYFVQRVRRLTAAHARRVAGFDETAAELAATRAEIVDRFRTAEVMCRELRPKADALAAGRWYRPAYWRARFDATLAPRLADAEARLASAQTSLDELAVREQKLAADRRLASEELAAERSRLIDTEVARRRTEVAARIADIDQAAAADEAQVVRLGGVLKAAAIDPTAGSPAVVAALDAARRELEFARAWKAEVDARADELVWEACQIVNVVAGPVAGFGVEGHGTLEPFDFLVIDDAHKLAEVDFLALARIARRCVLIGEPAELPKGRGRTPGPDLFTRLAAALRHEVWGREDSRLVCRLARVRAAERRRLECEPVADAPDIELRMTTPPGEDPTLAEVAFPERFTPRAAREYLVRELGEVTCEPRARTGTWMTTPDGPVVRFGPVDADAVLAEIGPGIREELAGLETRAVHFSADWSVERAREWATERIGRRDGGRLVSLTRPYRACPGLARWLNRAFAAGFMVAAVGDEEPHVEFLAVPDTDSRRREHARPGRVGGAGYEIDLSDPRQRAALPADIGDLPPDGFVNVPEAQALVRYLESLGRPGVAVTSPFPSQVAVLRRLAARSPRLSGLPVLDPVDVARFECDLLAVSLTRSHVARAVHFGETPAVLAGLLGRVRKKVLFAGDPGTLARRLQWQGPVDHLDGTEAARERRWVVALADCPRVAHPRRRPGPNESGRA